MAELRLRRDVGEPTDLTSDLVTPKEKFKAINTATGCCKSLIYAVLTASVVASLGLNYHFIGTRNDAVNCATDLSDGKTDDNAVNVNSLNGDSAEAEIIKSFPGFFKTEEDIKKIEEMFKKSSGMHEGGSTEPYVHYHGCCKTSAGLRAPNEGYNVVREKKKIVQLAKRKQYFYYETSTKVDKCHRNCKCTVRPVYNNRS